jgi:PH/SEC7 domain-containing protein
MASNSNRRISRTDMDFEQALLSEGTVKLVDSVDVNSLGVDNSPGQTSRHFASPTPPGKEKRTSRPHTQPATPVIVPPMPSPSAGPSSARLPSPSSSSGEIFYDAEDSDIQTKRRSLYRSPGTSSSPDLATLLRKAKERGGTVGAHHKKLEKRYVPPPPLPTTLHATEGPSTSGTRPRSSTSSATFSPNITASSSSMHAVKRKEGGRLQISTTGSNDDWVFTSPRSRMPSRDGGDTKVRTCSIWIISLIKPIFSQ